MLFSELQLIAPILRALEEEGYSSPTPIQEKSIPTILGGFDLLGCAQTGTGKTAAFAIPIIQLLNKKPFVAPEPTDKKYRARRKIRSLIVTPTRELAIQIHESFQAYGRHTTLRSTVVFGGVGQGAQVAVLREGVDILIATPGRLLDLMAQEHLSLRDIEIFVLDEADRMLDMGFIHDVKRLLAVLPAKKQTLFFSATMSPDIMKLAHSILQNPARVTVTPVSSTVEIITQQVYFVDRKNKNPLLLSLLVNQAIKTVLVFTRTKHGANKVVKMLLENGISAEAIHGNKAQTARQRALSNFKEQKTRVLVATDIAARGIDVDELEYVINYEVPNIPETYVHRIGRTGRAGAKGTAISFCDSEEKVFLASIEKLIAKKIPVIEGHSFPLTGESSPRNTPLTGSRPTPRDGTKKSWKKPFPEKPKTERIVKEKPSWSTDEGNLGPAHRRAKPRPPKSADTTFPRKSWAPPAKSEKEKESKSYPRTGAKPWKKDDSKQYSSEKPKKWTPRPPRKDGPRRPSDR